MKASLRTETLTRFKAGANNPLVRRQLKKPLAPGSSPGAGRESPVGERLLCATWERSPAMADFFSTLLGKLWASGRCGQSPTRANCHLVPRIGLAAESSRDSFVGGSTRVKLADASQVGFFYSKLVGRFQPQASTQNQNFDCPAGSAWTPRIATQLAIAAIPKEALDNRSLWRDRDTFLRQQRSRPWHRRRCGVFQRFHRRRPICARASTQHRQADLELWPCPVEPLLPSIVGTLHRCSSCDHSADRLRSQHDPLVAWPCRPPASPADREWRTRLESPSALSHGQGGTDNRHQVNKCISYTGPAALAAAAHPSGSCQEDPEPTR